LTEDVRRALRGSAANAGASAVSSADSAEPTREEMVRALSATDGNVSAAAELLGITRGRMRVLMTRYLGQK
jgi:transcriptional regulator of acetoin/glycerol metabolism